MSFFKDFKEFAVKGNLVDMAVGIIIGAAFGKVISSFVKDVVMPPIGKAMGGVDFAQLFSNLGDTAYATLAEATKAGAPVIRYGAFIQTIIDFIIIALVIFIVVKVINNAKKKEEAKPVEPSEDILLLREIRDNLKK